jgi:hypothetical protein
LKKKVYFFCKKMQDQNSSFSSTETLSIEILGNEKSKEITISDKNEENKMDFNVKCERHYWFEKPILKEENGKIFPVVVYQCKNCMKFQCLTPYGRTPCINLVSIPTERCRECVEIDREQEQQMKQ